MANAELLVVAITGMPGAGKSTAASALEKEGWAKIVMGDIIREETKRRGLEVNERNTAEVMKELRLRYGESAIAELCLKKIDELGSDMIVIDGIRSMSEVDVFRRRGEVLLIAIHASRRRRFELLRKRGRSDDPVDYEMFLKRDDRELRIGIGEAIALADEVISNEHISPETLSQTVVKMVRDWVDRVKA